MSDVIEFAAGDFVHLGLGATVVPLPTRTADVPDPSDPPTVLFITAGVGTQMRDR